MREKKAFETLIECDSDSTMALQFIASGVVPTHPYYLIVQKIRFAHTLLEANSCADSLAKKDTKFLILKDAPSNLNTSLMADALAVFFTRNR
ncbi:hypothetical protein HKD37_11G031711 [Glycine soja]